MRKTLFLLFLLVLSCSPSFAGTNKAAHAALKPAFLAIPGGQGGINFDDIVFSKTLHAMLVPSGRTGALNLIDTGTHAITSIGGFSEGKLMQGGRSREGGTTSADEGDGLIFAADRAKKTIVIIDPAARAIVFSLPLAGGSDYVRFVGATSEVWVTDPHNQQIEVFSFSPAPRPTLVHSAVIAVPGGPESLVIDTTRQRAYTNLWTGTTLAIDIKTHSIAATMPNSCQGSRGIALDEARGFLFIGGKEGKAVVLDLNHGGKLLSNIRSGSGVDIISYNPALSHLYLPGGGSATMAVIRVSSAGKLSLLGTARTVKGARCAVADDGGSVWVPDADHGRLLLFKDLFPGTR